VPRFVVLDHDFPVRHWDFLLEAGGVLRAWRLLAEPGVGRAVPAEPLPDHRIVYLDYEGPVSGGRGTVVRWDAGTFEWVHDRGEEVAVDAAGGKVSGRVAVERESGGWVWRCGERDLTVRET
jgi:hypothetical protein